MLYEDKPYFYFHLLLNQMKIGNKQWNVSRCDCLFNTSWLSTAADPYFKAHFTKGWTSLGRYICLLQQLAQTFFHLEIVLEVEGADAKTKCLSSADEDPSFKAHHLEEEPRRNLFALGETSVSGIDWIIHWVLTINQGV